MYRPVDSSSQVPPSGDGMTNQAFSIILMSSENTGHGRVITLVSSFQDFPFLAVCTGAPSSLKIAPP